LNCGSDVKVDGVYRGRGGEGEDIADEVRI
jgi:hypothetical protein